MTIIEHLAIKNYKSLRDIRLVPAPLSVLIGPNSSGKSNLFDALEFIRDLAVVGQNAVRIRDGFDTIAWSGELSQKIAFDLDGSLPTSENTYFRYAIELSRGPYGGWENSSERFAVGRDHEVRTLLEFPDKDKQASTYDLDGKLLSRQGLANVGSLLQYYSPSPGRQDPIRTFSKYVQSWGIYDPTPALMRGPIHVKRELNLSAKGENLAAVLHTLHSEFPDIFETIESHLRTLVPESKNLLSLLTPAAETYPGLEENGIASKIPASSMSAGTLRFLAFLAVLYSPEAPQLVCFEEPENNIHPHALELLIDILKTASRKRQVFLTTHSPYLLNFIDPNSVFVFEKVRGETSITEAGSRKNLKSLLRKVGLGEAWYAGSIGGVPTRTQ